MDVVLHSKCLVTVLLLFYVLQDVNLQSRDYTAVAKITFKNVIYIQNLDDSCFTCLCMAATNCDLTRQCSNGYCGPFKISKIYWADAGRVTLPNDDSEREQAYEDCVQNLPCAEQVVINYLAKYGRDCNSDGVTDCTDFAMLNFNGGWKCDIDMQLTEAGRNFSERFTACNVRRT